jgi:uncharacterized protein (TIGR00369 family)
MTHPTPAPRRSADEQAKLEAGFKVLFERGIPFNQVLGIEVVSTDPANPRFRFRMRPELVGSASHGQLHGGVTASVLDVMAGFALMVAIAEKYAHEPAAQLMPRFQRMGTLDLRIDYLRRGIGAWFEAGATVTRLGGRIGSTQMTLHTDDGTLIATGAASFVIG